MAITRRSFVQTAAIGAGAALTSYGLGPRP